MDITKADEMGFCFGVRKALTILDKAIKRYDRLETIGAVVHNQRVIEQLRDRGVEVIERLEERRSEVIAIPAHGVGPDILTRLKADGVQVIDATCPFVKRAQNMAGKLSRQGSLVVIFGDADHPEVRGVLDWASGSGIATTDSAILKSVKPVPRRVGILSQTTQSQKQFVEFVSDLLRTAPTRISEWQVINTICDATNRRQLAALALARKVDLMLVIGGYNSANTRRLAEICAGAGVPTHHIENESELDRVWLDGRRHVGITAGASTPDEVIDEVMARLEGLNKRVAG